MNKKISRRDALKIMGTGTLAVVAGTSGISSLLSSCSSPTTKNTKAGVLPEDEAKANEGKVKLLLMFTIFVYNILINVKYNVLLYK